jgi:hypothetical protein
MFTYFEVVIAHIGMEKDKARDRAVEVLIAGWAIAFGLRFYCFYHFFGLVASRRP